MPIPRWSGTMSTNRIRIISRDNGAGLSRDMKLMADILADAPGRQVETVGFGKAKSANWWREAGLWASRGLHSRVGTQIFAERVYSRCLPLAKRNVLVPNPEWFMDKWHAHLRHFDLVLCKTYHAQRIFMRLGCHTRYIGFTSEDRYDPTVARVPAFFHLAGRSSAKGTQVLVDTWSRHPEWPRLTIVQSKRNTQAIPATANIDHRIGYLDDIALRRLQNEHRFHICPSEAEGFGHYLMEGLSVGAVVITTDGEPMNELVGHDRGILIPAARTGKKELAARYFVDSQGIEAAVAQALSLTQQEYERLGLAARAFFKRNDRDFRMRFLSALADEPWRLGTAYGSHERKAADGAG